MYFLRTLAVAVLMSMASFAMNTVNVSSGGNISTAVNGGTVGTGGPCTGSGITIPNAGLCVIVGDGSYSGPISITKAGGSGARVVVISANKWGAHVSGANWQISGNYTDVIGFDMTAPSAGGYAVFIGLQTSFVNIQANNLHDFTTGGCGSYGVITDGRANPTGPSPGHDNSFIGNIIRHGGNYSFGTNNCVTLHGIYSTGARDIIQNNIISGITGWAIKRNSYGIGFCPESPSNQPCSQGVISGNTIFDNGGGISPTEQGDSGFVGLYDYESITNNIIVNNGTDAPNGGRFGIDYYHVTGTHLFVSNNLIYGNLPANYGHHDVTCTGGTPISGTDANGTAGGCPSANVKSDSGTSSTFASFQVDTNSAPAGSYSATNYKLKLGSSAISGGTSSCAASPGINPCAAATDFAGTAQTSPVAIGAFTFGVSGSVPSPPSGLGVVIN